jgi:hypothetical protein
MTYEEADNVIEACMRSQGDVCKVLYTYDVRASMSLHKPSGMRGTVGKTM